MYTYRSARITISLPTGLGARNSGAIAIFCQEFEPDREILIGYDEECESNRKTIARLAEAGGHLADGRSVIELLSLDAPPGSQLVVRVERADSRAQEIADRIVEFMSGKEILHPPNRPFRPPEVE